MANAARNQPTLRPQSREHVTAGTSRQPAANERLRLLTAINAELGRLKIKPVYRRKVPSEVLEVWHKLLQADVRVADVRSLMALAPERPAAIPTMRPGTSGQQPPSMAGAEQVPVEVQQALRGQVSGEYRAARETQPPATPSVPPLAASVNDPVVQALAQAIARMLVREISTPAGVTQ
jgi:hypothetical protein